MGLIERLDTSVKSSKNSMLQAAGEKKRAGEPVSDLVTSDSEEEMASLTRSNSWHSINVKLHVCQLHQACLSPKPRLN